MLFSSLNFLLFFLPLCLLLYYLFPGIQARNNILLVFSLVFYAWGEPVYVLLILISILLNYLSALYMERIPDWKKSIFVTGICLNLLLLGFFKYYAFLLNSIDGFMGWNLEVRHLPLPIGISFYTFQALSYLIDLYRGRIKLQRSLPRFALYISLFPQLIAGPIVRYSEVEEQLSVRSVDLNSLGVGLMRFLYGLAKKVLLANNLGAFFEKSGLERGPVSLLGAWLGLIAFSLQIYFDFSGYSDMAIGLGKAFGFHFPENFRAPYGSKSITEFWRRWHISLGSWFREYVYIPLGGSQKGLKKQVLNICIVWALTGLWHGAAWNFVIWGLYYALLLLFEKLVLSKVKIPVLMGRIYTLLAVFLGWGIFLCDSMEEVGQCLRNLFALSGLSLWDQKGLRLLVTSAPLLLLCALLSAPCFVSIREKMMEKKPLLAAVVSVFLLLLSLAFLVTQDYNPFLYFRF